MKWVVFAFVVVATTYETPCTGSTGKDSLDISGHFLIAEFDYREGNVFWMLYCWLIRIYCEVCSRQGWELDHLGLLKFSY